MNPLPGATAVWTAALTDPALVGHISRSFAAFAVLATVHTLTKYFAPKGSVIASRTSVVHSTLHAFGTSLLALSVVCGLVPLGWWPLYGLPLSAGYLAYDFVVWCIPHRDMPMAVHHFVTAGTHFAIGIAAAATIAGAGDAEWAIWTSACAYLAELAVPFVNLRWYLQKTLTTNSWLYTANSAVLLPLWALRLGVCVRNGVVMQSRRDAYSANGYSDLVALFQFGHFVIFVLSFYWLNKLFSRGVAAFFIFVPSGDRVDAARPHPRECDLLATDSDVCTEKMTEEQRLVREEVEARACLGFNGPVVLWGAITAVLATALKGGWSPKAAETFSWMAAPLSSAAAPLTIVPLYVIAAYTLKAHMAKRGRPYPIPTWLMPLHNFGISFTSLVIVLGCGSATMRRWEDEGTLSFLWCEDPTVAEGDSKGPLAFWTYCFYMCKYWETGDTAIGLLRGSRMPHIHLQIYHHALAIFMGWIWVETAQSLTPMGVCGNACVHVFMYTYFAARALKITVPTVLKQALTKLQVIQFVIGFLMLALAFYTDFQAIGYAGANRCSGFGPGSFDEVKGRWVLGHTIWFNAAFNLSMLVSFIKILALNASKRGSQITKKVS